MQSKAYLAAPFDQNIQKDNNDNKYNNDNNNNNIFWHRCFHPSNRYTVLNKGNENSEKLEEINLSCFCLVLFLHGDRAILDRSESTEAIFGG